MRDKKKRVHMQHPDRPERTRCGQRIKSHTIVVAYEEPDTSQCDCKMCRRLWHEDQEG